MGTYARLVHRLADRHPATVRVGHHVYAYWLLAALIGPAAYIDPFLGTLMLAAWLIWTVCVSAHLGAMCVACAARIPLDPVATVERDRWWLYRVHHLGFLWFGLGLNVVLTYVYPPAAWVAFATVMLTVVVSMSKHGRVEPWCPECHNGDGDHPAIVTPEPVHPSARS
jgi:hypothetical protein